MTEVPRDQWGRPLIQPLDGGKPTAYTRVSTLAKALDDLNGLMAWKQRKTAEGLLRRPDLLTRLAGALANGDPDVDWPTKKALNDLCREATEAAGATSGASAGTGFHSLTEAIDRGDEPLFVPESDKHRLDAYRQAMAGYHVLEAELFVVNDTVQAAGSFDKLLGCPDGRVLIADVKTGRSEADYPFSTTLQISTYANASRYDVETGERSPIHPDLDPTAGILIHMPATGGCNLYELDLTIGWEAAQLAAHVRRVRAVKADTLITGQLA
jgi:hypothetical protein